MVDFQQIHQTKTTASFWIDFLFYFVCYLLAVAVICFAIFSLKAYFLHQNINDLDQKIAAAGTSTQKQEEKDLITYKKRVEDFTSLINGHTISLNIFNPRFFSKIKSPKRQTYCCRVRRIFHYLFVYGDDTVQYLAFLSGQS